MQKTSRTDRILIALALAILLMASSLFYFDGWMWGGRHDHGEHIGTVSTRSGDIRVKYDGDLNWQRAASGQELNVNDSVYVGANSNAKLQLGESEMQVNENSLVVLRRTDNVNFMNLSYGSVFGKMAMNEKVMIDTGEGKPIELSSTSDSQILVRKNKGHTELSVVSGEASVMIDGKKTAINKSSRVVVDGSASAQVEQVGLALVKPLRAQVLYSDHRATIPFEWRWSSGRAAGVNEKFLAEFSDSPNFDKILRKINVTGQLGTSMNVEETLSLYYRVHGPNGAVSGTEKVNFVRQHQPLVVRPVANAGFWVEDGQTALVDVEFRIPDSASIWYQIAADTDFKNVITNQNTHEPKGVRDLGVGKYFMRARSDYGDGHASEWTPVVPFQVERKFPVLNLTEAAPLNTKVIIPNRHYPAPLYSSGGAKVREYLASHGLLQQFFPFPPGSYDQLKVVTGPDEVFTQTGTAWPKEKLYPASHTYRYQATKQGFEASPWSPEKQLDISMEPPRPVGDVRYGPTAANGVSDGSWNFTPLLFARSYDVEVSHDPGLRRPRNISVNRPEVTAKLSGENYWRVRARDIKGRIISEFSPIYKIKGGVPLFLAKVEPPKPPPPPRAPAEAPAQTSSIKMDSVGPQEPLQKSGWWAWIGGGEDYAEYQQSLPGASTLTAYHTGGVTEYLEGGFLGTSGWGGSFSYKYTPVDVNPTNSSIPVSSSNYNWTSVAVEGLRRISSNLSLFGDPVTYGLRVGIQEHQLPFLLLQYDSLGNPSNLVVKSNQMINASLGFSSEWVRRRWTYYWLMRYQYPLTTKADGFSQFDISPVFAFDGSIGTSYNFTPRFKAGMFWYGQWHQFNFDYNDGETQSHGFQSLFYSNVDFRLGYDF